MSEITFADALKRFRRAKGLRQIDVANFLGVSQQNYQAYENKSVPNAAMLKKLAQEYHVTVDYLIGLDDEPNRPLLIDTASVEDTDVDELTRAAQNNRILEYHQALANILSKQGIKI